MNKYTFRVKMDDTTVIEMTQELESAEELMQLMVTFSRAAFGWDVLKMSEDFYTPAGEEQEKPCVESD